MSTVKTLNTSYTASYIICYNYTKKSGKKQVQKSEIGLKPTDFSQPQTFGFSLPEAQSMPVQVRSDYRGPGDPVEPAYVFTPPVLFDYVSDDGNSMDKFNSLTATAQEKLIEILRETKKALGNSYVPVYITSGLRTPKYHFQTVLEKRLKNQTAYKYYLEQSGSASPTTKYLKLIEYQLYKKELNKEDWLNITCMKEDIVKIKQGDFAEAEKILIQLMEDWVIKGTDHREGGAVDLRNTSSYIGTTTELQKFATNKGYYNYGGDGKNKNGTPRDHMHITLVPLSRIH